MFSRIVLAGLLIGFGVVQAMPGQPAKKNPQPLTEADLQKMPAAEVKELFKKVMLPEDDPDPDAPNKGKLGAPSTGEVAHTGMVYGPCLACTVDLPDPTKIVVSDNQGEWVPSSKVSLIKPGGFYGYPRKGELTPTKYEAPLFWLPMNIDNSSGGQCWAGDKWGPLSGKLLHTSDGTCSLMYAMTQKVGATWNAAVVQMPLLFRSGIMRARVNPKDGQVYVVGLRGWQTLAQDVGCAVPTE
jgi:hypothetical protein